MGRPIKAGLDYFPHNCIPDQRIDLIRAEFGLTGYAVIYRLYEKIYTEKGYFCEWTKDVALMFAQNNSVGVNVVSEIVNASIRRGIFDSRLYKKYGILTSADIQEIYFEATERRKQIFLFKEYLLVNCTHLPDNAVINSINVYINSINVCRNPQSKVEESKVNESKVNSRNSISIPLKDGSMYEISESKVNDLQQLYPNIHVIHSLRKMADYLNNNQQRRKSYLAMDNYIKMWLEKDSIKAQSTNNSQQQTTHSPSYDISFLDGIGLIN